MIQKINILEAREALKILELQRLSYPIEADLIGSDAIPGLNETLEQLQNCNETFYGFLEGQEILGAISFKLDVHLLDIHGMMCVQSIFAKALRRRLSILF